MRWQDLLSLVNRQEVQLSESRQLSSEFLEQQRRLRDAEDELQAAHKTNKDLQVLTTCWVLPNNLARMDSWDFF